MAEEKNSEFTSGQLFWYKHKNKVIGGIITLVLLILFGVGMWFIFNNKSNPSEDTQFVSDETRIADYLIVPSNDKIFLAQGKNDENKGIYQYNKVDEKAIEKSIYSTSNDLDSLYVMDTKTKEVTQYIVDNAKLGSKKVMTYKGDLAVESFKYDDNVFAGYTDGYIVVQYKDNTEVIKVEKDVTNYLITDNHVVYAMGSKVYSYDVNSKKTKSVDLNKEIKDIELINNQVVAIGKFGETKKTSTIASMRVADLYGTGLTTIEYTDATALQNSSENVDFYVFSKDDEKNSITTVTIKDEILKVEKLGGTFDSISEKDVGRNGYAYLVKDNKISVIDVNSGKESGVFNIDKAECIAPVFY